MPPLDKKEITVLLRPAWRTDTPLRLTNEGGLRVEEALRTVDPAGRTALELALHLRQKAPHSERLSVRVLCVGPARDEPVLREALALGADSVLRVWGRNWPETPDACGDASTATTQALARAAGEVLRREGPRFSPVLILCGERSADAGHEAFGACLAQALNRPFAHRAVDVAATSEGWRVQVALDRGWRQELSLTGCAVVTVAARDAALGESALPSWQFAQQASIPLALVESPWIAAAVHLRPPLPRVKPLPMPAPGLDAEARIRSMTTFPSGGGGVRLGADLSTQTQVETLINLLTARGYLRENPSPQVVPIRIQ